jgi:cysteine desulfurase
MGDPVIYLDHHATTPCDPRVVEAMAPYWSQDFGNASSRTHRYGWRAEAAVELARERIAAALGAGDPREIVFTSGATESDNLALQGLLAPGDHLVTTAIEHAAILDTARALAERGVGLSVLAVDGEGRLDPDDLAKAITPATRLVSIGAANGEIGVLQPLPELARVCAEREVLFHTDAAQAVGKVPLDVEALGVELLSCSAHKVYGPKGVGALYVRRRSHAGARVRLAPLLHGGGQERGLRSGTLPVPLIVGFAEALALARELRESEAKRLALLRDGLFDALVRALPGVWRNGPGEGRLPGNLNVSFDGVEADALLARLEDIALSTGSACASARAEPSHVLAALGLPPERQRGAIRIGLGRGTREADIARAAERIAAEVRAIRREKAPRAALTERS